MITAGAGGIGKEAARAFVANGAMACVCDINAQALETAAQDIAGLIVSLASDAGKSISGQVIPIDNDAQTSAY